MSGSRHSRRETAEMQFSLRGRRYVNAVVFCRSSLSQERGKRCLLRFKLEVTLDSLNPFELTSSLWLFTLLLSGTMLVPRNDVRVRLYSRNVIFHLVESRTTTAQVTSYYTRCFDAKKILATMMDLALFELKRNEGKDRSTYIHYLILSDFIKSIIIYI